MKPPIKGQKWAYHCFDIELRDAIITVIQIVYSVNKQYRYVFKRNCFNPVLSGLSYLVCFIWNV